MQKAARIFLLALFTLTGCGNAASEFVGTWSMSGTVTSSANGQSVTGPLTGNRTILSSSGNDITLSNATCNIPAIVSGQTATVQNYTCTTTNANGLTENDTYTGGTMTLAGTVITFSMSGSFTETENGESLAGTFVASGTMTKVGQ